MTKHKLNGETLKLLLGVIAGVAGAWLGIVFFFRQFQCGLYGVPTGMCTVMGTPSAIGVIPLVLFCVFVLAVIAAAVRALKLLWRRLWWRLTKRDLPNVAEAAAVVSLPLVTLVLLVPFWALSKLNGYLWDTSFTAGSDEADVLPLVMNSNAPASLVACIIALGVILVTGIFAIRLVRSWAAGRQRLPLVKGPLLVLLGFLQFAAVLVVFGAALPLVSKPPVVMIHLKEAGSTPPISAVLVRQEESFVLALPDKPDATPLVLIPGEAISHIDYVGGTKDIKQILCKRALKALHNPQEQCTMPIKFPFFGRRISFENWAASSFVVLVFGLFFAIPLSSRAEDVGKKPPAPAAKNGAPVAATATRRVVAETHGFYPQLHDAAHQTADVVNQFANVFLRRAGDVKAGDVWILTQSQPQRLTQDGGYVSLRPSADGSKVAFIRAGTIGILDVATKQVRPVPTESAITRLLGWDEPNGALLGVRGDGHVVSITIADGHVKTLQDQPEAPDELAAHEVLAHLTPYPGVLYVEDIAGSWAVMEKKWGVQDRTTYLVSRCILADPVWSSAGIFYIGGQC